MSKPKPPSRQRAWAIKKAAAGCCIVCGQPRGDDGSAFLCRRCADQKAEGQRLRRSIDRRKIQP